MGRLGQLILVFAATRNKAGWMRLRFRDIYTKHEIGGRGRKKKDKVNLGDVLKFLKNFRL